MISPGRIRSVRDAPETHVLLRPGLDDRPAGHVFLWGLVDVEEFQNFFSGLVTEKQATKDQGSRGFRNGSKLFRANTAAGSRKTSFVLERALLVIFQINRQFRAMDQSRSLGRVNRRHRRSPASGFRAARVAAKHRYSSSTRLATFANGCDVVEEGY